MCTLMHQAYLLYQTCTLLQTPDALLLLIPFSWGFHKNMKDMNFLLQFMQSCHSDSTQLGTSSGFILFTNIIITLIQLSDSKLFAKWLQFVLWVEDQTIPFEQVWAPTPHIWAARRSYRSYRSPSLQFVPYDEVWIWIAQRSNTALGNPSTDWPWLWQSGVNYNKLCSFC